MEGSRTKQQKACDENVLRKKEFRLNFSPAEEIQTSISSLQWEYSSCQQIGFFTVVARDTFYTSNWKWANVKPIMQESWGQRENKEEEVYDLMVSTEKQGRKDNISIWKGGHRHTARLPLDMQILKALHWCSQIKFKKYQGMSMQ